MLPSKFKRKSTMYKRKWYKNHSKWKYKYRSKNFLKSMKMGE